MTFTPNPLFFTRTLAITATSLSLLLSACAPLVIGGVAAGTALVVTDRRTSGTQLEDQNITFKIERAGSQHFGHSARIKASVYENQVLLTGEAPSTTVKYQATTLAKSVEHVQTVYNHITIKPVASFQARSTDTWITSKVRGALINAPYVPSGTISVTTDHGVVYLQGKLTQAESNYAAQTAAKVNGVTQVVKLFKIISREEALRLSRMKTASTAYEDQPPPASAITDETQPNWPTSNTVETTDSPSAQAIPIQ